MRYVLNGKVVLEESTKKENYFESIKDFLKKKQYKLDYIKIGVIRIVENYEIVLGSIEYNKEDIEAHCSRINTIEYDDGILNTMSNYCMNIERLANGFYTTSSAQLWNHLAALFDQVQAFLVRLKENTNLETGKLESSLLLLFEPMKMKDNLQIADVLHWEVVQELNLLINQYKKSNSIKES